MICKSCVRQFEDNNAVIAVSDQVNSLMSDLLSLGQKFRQKFSFLISFGALSLFGLLFMQLCLVSAVQATIPDADELDWVCREVAVRMVAGLGERRIDNVAVYFFRPQGSNLEKMDDRDRMESGIVAQAMEDVLTNRSEFKVLNRNSEVWAAVLHEEDNHEILDIGTGFGADWIVTGEFWDDGNGCFHLRTRLFNGKSGESLVSALVESPFVSSQNESMQGLFVGFVILLILVVGGTLYFVFRKHKNRYCKRVDVGVKNRNQPIQRLNPSKKIEVGSCVNYKVDLKEQLMTKSVNPKHYQIDSVNRNYTKPRTWGVFAVYDEIITGAKKSFDLGITLSGKGNWKRNLGQLNLLLCLKDGMMLRR